MNASTSPIFTLLVDNEFGVLTRITALIRRSGWNIRSLAVAETAEHYVSRLTICMECRNQSLENVLERLGRMDCVREILLFSEENQVACELALIRLRTENKAGIQSFCEETGAQALEEKDGQIVLSLTCEPNRLDSLIPRLKENGLVEITRTGAITLRRYDKEADGNE